MRTKTFVLAAVLIFAFAGFGRAEIVQLDLFSLGIPATFNDNSSYWQSNFDLGVTFIEISHVYINWSGAIMAGLWQDIDPITYQPIGDPYPINEGVYADFGIGQFGRQAVVTGGMASYPLAEAFDIQSEVTSRPPPTTWTDLFDGKGTVVLGYDQSFPGTGRAVILNDGSVTLDSVILIVDGTLVPEPNTLAFFACALPILKIFQKRKSQD